MEAEERIFFAPIPVFDGHGHIEPNDFSYLKRLFDEASSFQLRKK